MSGATTTRPVHPELGLITVDTPVGHELEGVQKVATIQLMGSRVWGRFNPNHWDRSTPRTPALPPQSRPVRCRAPT